MSTEAPESDRYVPKVKVGHAFREISLDFTKPVEIFREALANALDAYATRIWLRTTVEKRRGREIVIIDLADDGFGMTLEALRSFLNLSDSQKPDAPPHGRTKRRMTGYKGHGSKIYYNSDELEVLTYHENGTPQYCKVVDPKGSLAEGEPPTASIDQLTLEELKERRQSWGFPELAANPGTVVRVVGYHDNRTAGLDHTLLTDYVRWFTRWSSWEPKLRRLTETTSDEVDDFSSCSLFVRGFGKEPNRDEDEKIPFGHVFPDKDCTDIRELRKKDNVDPLKHYVRTWAFTNEPLLRNAHMRIDFIFALEGEGARREYNDMLRRQGKPRRAGDYLSEERYGLWLGRDYVPIQRFNSWVSEKSEYTRMHAFVNCDDLSLTANRGSIENTPKELLDDIEDTVRKIFSERVEKDSDFEKFEDELQAVQRHRHASKEASAYKKRVKRLEAKKIVTIKGVDLFSPHSEMDLIALYSGVQALVPEILPFAVREYDSHFGFDGLATRNKELDLSEVEHLFVEFKFHLKSDFNHTFDKLDSIICWEAKLRDGQEVNDLGGRKGTFRITVNDNKKSRFIVRPDSSRNVAVIVLPELLEEHGYLFKNAGE